MTLTTNFMPGQCEESHSRIYKLEVYLQNVKGFPLVKSKFLVKIDFLLKERSPHSRDVSTIWCRQITLAREADWLSQKLISCVAAVEVIILTS